jgi:hypothetical protein
VPSAVGLDGLLDFRMDVMLEDEPLTKAEVATLLAGTEDLVLLRGKWVEVDRARMGRTMEQFQAAEQLAARDGLSFSEAMRMLAGASVTRDDAAAADTDWARVIAGPWLEQTLRALRAPDGEDVDPGSTLRGTLRPTESRNAMAALAGGPAPQGLPGRRHGRGKTIRCYRCCWWKGPCRRGFWTCWWRRPRCWELGRGDRKFA